MQFPRLLCSGDWSGDTAAVTATEVSCRRQPFQRDRRARLSPGWDGGSRARCVPRAGGPQALGPKEGGARPLPRPPASSRPDFRHPALSLPTTTVPTRAPPDGEQRPPTPIFPEGTLAVDTSMEAASRQARARLPLTRERWLPAHHRTTGRLYSLKYMFYVFVYFVLFISLVKPVSHDSHVAPRLAVSSRLVTEGDPLLGGLERPRP